MPDRLLILDDDVRLADMLRTYLTDRGGFTIEVRHDVATGLVALREGDYDALVLDVMLPDGDGFDVLRTVRATDSIPIVMLTARGDATDRIVGLELGADDYLPKPFDPRELLARLRAVLRRRVPAALPPDGGEGPLVFDGLVIDPRSRSVRRDGAEAKLTSHQFELLLAMARSAGRVLSRDQLSEAVGGGDVDAFDRAIDVHVSRIRAAIEADPKQPRRIITVRGVGYVFTRDEA